MSTIKSRFPLFVYLICLGTIFTACDKKTPGLRLDTNFSSNLVELTEEWPGTLELTDAQSRLLEEKGEPSYERILWDPDGSIKSYMDVAVELRNKAWREKDRTWIFLDTNKEYEFVSRTNYVEKPLTDMMKTLCKYGDPQQTSILQQGRKDPPIVVWSYISAGKRFHFIEGLQYRVEHFRPMKFRPY